MERPSPLPKRVDRIAIARYAVASNDFTPIHLEDDVALGVGLPGVIAHGLLTFGYVGQFLTDACGGDPQGVKRMRMRFVAPVRPGDDLLVEADSVERNGSSAELRVVVRRGEDVVAEGDATIDVGDG